MRAAREVILCGGAINSPQLLLLSGIGPQQHLTDLGIAVAHDLPGVGQSMQDHYQARIVCKCRFPITVNDIMLSRTRMVKTGLEYLLFRKGALAIAAAQAGLFARTRKELATPDIQYATVIFSADRPAEGLHKFSGFSLVGYQLRPESRGELKLKTANPADPPAMHPNYLATETDRRTIIDGLKLGRRLLATPDMQHFITAEHIPGPQVQTDDELLDYAKQYGGTVFHPTSTCRMGSDPMAVVDPELRVHGIGNLRVVDASIMPAVVSGNTNAATIMIGEKAADLVRQQLRRTRRLTGSASRCRRPSIPGLAPPSVFPAHDADAYERVMGRWSRRLAPLLIRFGGLADGDRVLDVGCGTGNLSFALPEAANVATVTGIDQAQVYLAFARSRTGDPRFSFQHADARALPFPDASFDRAVLDAGSAVHSRRRPRGRRDVPRRAARRHGHGRGVGLVRRPAPSAVDVGYRRRARSVRHAAEIAVPITERTRRNGHAVAPARPARRGADQHHHPHGVRQLRGLLAAIHHRRRRPRTVHGEPVRCDASDAA